MAEEKSYYVVDPGGRYRCLKCDVPLVKANAVFGYLDNAFPVELPVCPKCGFVFVPEELAMARCSPWRRCWRTSSGAASRRR